jgi:2-polyprenyl-6-methoxyphenol hydroxylase-like FAD-dependent oxidoreductase
MAYDVIVIGARCAGAPLAMLLARSGHRVLLADRARFPSDTLSTHWILAPGVALLTEWGLLDGLRASGCPPINTLRLTCAGTVLAGRPTTPDGPAVTYAPRRTVLDALLVDAARTAGATVRQGMAVRDVVWRDGAVAGVIGQMAGGPPVTEWARVVVGADGRNSSIARAVGAGITTDRGVLAATVYGYWSGLPGDGAEIEVRPEAGISFWPTHGGLTVVSLTLQRHCLRGGRGGAGAVYADTLRKVPEIAGRLRDARLEGQVRAATNMRNFFRVSHGPGWALAGDAGHQTDPIGARGISGAFTDARNLAAAIDAGLRGTMTMDRSLARYEARRNADRAAMFEFVCKQAPQGTLDDEFLGLLRAVSENPRAAGDLLAVFAGGQRIEQFFKPANISRITAAANGGPARGGGRR